MRPSKRFFLILLAALAALLVVYGVLRMINGPFLPAAIDKDLPDVIMFVAVGVMLWNRKIRSDEQKEAAARKEAAAAEEKSAEESLDEHSAEEKPSAPE
jgi:membrane protein required for beta-lactamase induction